MSSTEEQFFMDGLLAANRGVDAEEDLTVDEEDLADDEEEPVYLYSVDKNGIMFFE